MSSDKETKGLSSPPNYPDLNSKGRGTSNRTEVPSYNWQLHPPRGHVSVSRPLMFNHIWIWGLLRLGQHINSGFSGSSWAFFAVGQRTLCCWGDRCSLEWVCTMWEGVSCSSWVRWSNGIYMNTSRMLHQSEMIRVIQSSLLLLRPTNEATRTKGCLGNSLPTGQY